ncbi:MAG: sulfatase-like hydrolase/transferase [Nocardioides sp.]
MPVCTPARSCLQTGLYATASGCWRNELSLGRDARTIAHEFAAAGYRTGYIGKWHLAESGIGPVPRELRCGYQDWLASNVLEMTSDAYDCRVYDAENREVRLPGYRVDALTDAAIRYVDERSRSEQPFFLFISLLEPHHQNHRDDYPAPDGYADRYAGQWMPPDLAALRGNAPQQLPGYLGMIRRIDEAFGRLLEALKSLHLDANTVVAFTSDHGSTSARATTNTSARATMPPFACRSPWAAARFAAAANSAISSASSTFRPPCSTPPASPCRARCKAVRSCRWCAATGATGRARFSCRSAKPRSAAPCAPSVGNIPCALRSATAAPRPAANSTSNNFSTTCSPIRGN